MSRKTFEVLAALEDAATYENPLTVDDIGEIVDAAPSTIYECIRKLSRNGYNIGRRKVYAEDSTKTGYYIEDSLSLNDVGLLLRCISQASIPEETKAHLRAVVSHLRRK